MGQQLIKKFRLWWHLPGYEKWVLTEAVLFLSLAKLVVLAVPFRRLAPWLGKTSTTPLEPRLRLPPKRIGDLIDLAARHLPWPCLCLVQAVAANAMLRRRRFPAQTFIGIRLDEHGELHSHAWVSCGDTIVTGDDNVHSYQVITDFNPQHLRNLEH